MLQILGFPSEHCRSLVSASGHPCLALLTRTSCPLQGKAAGSGVWGDASFLEGRGAEPRLGTKLFESSGQEYDSKPYEQKGLPAWHEAGTGWVKTVYNHQFCGTIGTPSLRACQSMNILALQKVRESSLLCSCKISSWVVLLAVSLRPNAQSTA